MTFGGSGGGIVAKVQNDAVDAVVAVATKMFFVTFTAFGGYLGAAGRDP